MQELTDELLERIAIRLRAMSNPIRLRVLHSLEHHELTVGEIVTAIGVSQSNASKHLAVLRGAGLVGSRREGARVIYRISDTAVLDVCRTICDSLHRRASAEAEVIERGREAMLDARM